MQITTPPLLRRPPAGSWKEHPKVKLQRKSGLRALTVGAVAITGALVLTACGSDDNTRQRHRRRASASASSSQAPCDSSAKGQLLGVRLQRSAERDRGWGQGLPAGVPGATINYKASSSGEGIVDFNQGTDAFAGSDSPLEPEEVASSKKVCASGQGINIPMVGGPIALGYNLAGVDNLVLDAKTLAKIFNSKITNWNDPAIKTLNPGANLPGTKIQAFHRSGRLRHHGQPHQVPQGAAPADWPYETRRRGGQGRPGRRRGPRASPRRSSRPKAPSATSSCPTRPPADPDGQDQHRRLAPVEATSRTPPRASPPPRSSAPAPTWRSTCARTPPRRTTPTRSSW